MKRVSRDEWGMPPIGPNHTTRDLDTITEFNVHHSASQPPRNHTGCDDSVRAFDGLHRHNGWACIGYTGVICTHGYVFAGRPFTVVPAAAENHNSHIIAYCLIGFGDEDPSTEQLRALLETYRHATDRLGRHLKITTHREVEPPGYTECPGDGIEHAVNKWRKSVDG